MWPPSTPNRQAMRPDLWIRSMSSAVRACSRSGVLWMNRSATSNSRNASCSDVWLFCVADSTKIDQYCAPIRPSRMRGMSAHRVGCTLLMSKEVRSPALVSRNMEGKSLCVSMRGAFSSRALARSKSLGSTTAELSDAIAALAKRDCARSAELPRKLVCSRKRRREIK